MANNKGERSYKQESNGGDKPVYESFLGSMGEDVDNAKAFNWRAENTVPIIHLLQAAADAACMISFNHNHSGGVTVSIFVEGKRDYIQCADGGAFNYHCERIFTALNAYTKSKGWQITPLKSK
jgi:hypothetical protein